MFRDALAAFALDTDADGVPADLRDSLRRIARDVSRRRIFKYGYEMPQTWLGFSWSERLGLSSPTIEAEVGAARETASYHAEIVVPEELRITGSFILDVDSAWNAKRILAVEGESDRASLYAPGVRENSIPVLSFGVRPERSGFPTVATATAWVTAAILVAGGWVGDGAATGLAAGALLVLGFSDGVVETGWRIGSAVAVIVACILTSVFVRASPSGVR